MALSTLPLAFSCHRPAAAPHCAPPASPPSGSPERPSRRARPGRYRVGSARPRSPWSRGRCRCRGRARRAGSAGCRRPASPHRRAGRPRGRAGCRPRRRATARTAPATAAAGATPKRAPGRRRLAAPWPGRLARRQPLARAARRCPTALTPLSSLAPSRPLRFSPFRSPPLLLLTPTPALASPRPPRRLNGGWEPQRVSGRAVGCPCAGRAGAAAAACQAAKDAPGARPQRLK